MRIQEVGEEEEIKILCNVYMPQASYKYCLILPTVLPRLDYFLPVM